MSNDTQVKQEDKAPEPTTKALLLRLDASMRFILPLDQQNKIRELINDLLATVRREEREAAFRDARATVNKLFHNSEVNHSRWNEAITAASTALEASASEKGEMNE